MDWTMNMSIDEILQMIQDLRSQLELLGVTKEGLWFAAGAASLLFMLSLREVLSWYFKVNRVRDEIMGLRAQIAELQNSVNATRELLTGGAALSPLPLKPEELVKIAEGMRDNAPKFRFDH